MFPEGRILDFVIIGVLALIVVGPKDLPVLMRKVGQFLAHMRSMAAEFRASFDEMARQSELDELRREVEALRSGNSLGAAVGLDGDLGVSGVINDIHGTLHPAEGAANAVDMAAMGATGISTSATEPVEGYQPPSVPTPDVAAQKDGGSATVSATL